MFKCVWNTDYLLPVATGLDVTKFAASFTWLTSYTSDMCPEICVLVCIVKIPYFICTIIRSKKKVLNTERSFLSNFAYCNIFSNS